MLSRPRSRCIPSRARSSADSRDQSAMFAARKRLEHAEQLLDVVIVVAKPSHPQGLVVADDVRLVLGEDPAITAGDDELAVNEVADAFEDRPLTGLGPRSEERTGLRHEGTQGRRCGRLGWIVAAEGREEALPVGFGFADRIRARHAGAPFSTGVSHVVRFSTIHWAGSGSIAARSAEA